ncbi:unnamed protein product [Didymodactylos carnosus]|uniref:Uncharacterized protein n=1 Tax=Didymodactylos carnosus TaxID=1234261 RepID=A0A8S2TT42_9BILA|nr:unnamed protein product [Didymodactylos carnosus]
MSLEHDNKPVPEHLQILYTQHNSLQAQITELSSKIIKTTTATTSEMDRLNEKMTNLQEQVEGISISTDKGVRALSAQFEDSMRELRHLISRPTYTEELLTSQQDAPTTMSPPIHISSTIASASTSHLQYTVLIQPPTPSPTFSGLTSEKPLHFLVKLQ